MSVLIMKRIIAPTKYRMMNLDIARNIWTPTAAICPARRKIMPKGSRYRDQPIIF
jgi:hypothetical protein